MGKQLLFGVVLAALAGAVYFYLNYQFESHYENGKFSYVKIVAKRGPADPGSDRASAIPPADSVRPTFRMATFNLGRLDDAKAANRRVNDVLVHLLPQFELIALQGIRGKNQGVLVRLVEQLNAASGRAFDFATCPTQQRDAIEHYTAFIFDRADRGRSHHGAFRRRSAGTVSREAAGGRVPCAGRIPPRRLPSR